MMTEDEKDVWKAAFAAAYVAYWSERNRPGKTRSEGIDTAQSRAAWAVVAFRELKDAGLLPWAEGREEQ